MLTVRRLRVKKLQIISLPLRNTNTQCQILKPARLRRVFYWAICAFANFIAEVMFGYLRLPS